MRFNYISLLITFLVIDDIAFDDIATKELIKQNKNFVECFYDIYFHLSYKRKFEHNKIIPEECFSFS